MWRGGLQLLVGDLDLNLMWLVFLASFYSCGCFCCWDSDVLGRNTDGIGMRCELKRGVDSERKTEGTGKKKSMAEIGKRTRIRIERGLEYGLNIDRKRNTRKEEAEKKYDKNFAFLLLDINLRVSTTQLFSDGL